MTSAQAGLVLQHLRRLAGTRRAAQTPDGQLLERFTAHCDEAAFAALVRQHGPMVLNVCRSVLRHEQDAEDAFQATFLVLARKADTIRQPEAVAGFLYEVAYHVAVKAQANAARRRARERRAAPMAPADPTLDMTVRDLQRVLHEELRRLPDKYRLPLVLCYLEGRSHEEAARQLGWSKGTFRGRLDRGREHLRRRLAGRGVLLSALVGAAAVASPAAAEALVDSVVRVAVPSAVDGAASGALSAKASALAEGVIRAMFTSKLKVATAVLLVVGLVATGAAVLAQQARTARERPVLRQKAAAKSPKPAVAQEAPKPPPADDKDTITYSGRVLGPNGRPVLGAKLYLTLSYREPGSPLPESATTGPNGRFQFTVPKAQFSEQFTVVAATAANHGIGWVEVPADGKRNDLTLRLVADDVPISGQIVDLEGKPVPGATLQVQEIRAAPKEDLGPWLEAVKDKKGLSLQLQNQYLGRYTSALSPEVTTDAEGRFRLLGIGRNRLIQARLDGPTIASQHLHILTRPGKVIEVTYDEGHPKDGVPRTVTTYYGASFRHVAAPAKPVIGVVRDKDTKKPLAGVTIRSYAQAIAPSYHRAVDTVVRTTTDSQGRYRLGGMPKGKGFLIVAIPDSDQPYVVTNKEVPDSLGLGPVTVDIELKRGVWIEGKITDKATGKPLRRPVEYFSLYSNPNLKDYPGFDGTALIEPGRTIKDGSYRVAGLPGPGLVAVWRVDSYLSAPDRDDEEGVNQKTPSTAPYQLLPLVNYGALAPVDPPKGVEAVKRDVTLDPGWTFTVIVLGPDGKPLAGAVGFGAREKDARGGEGKRTAEFAVHTFNPRRPYDVFFRHLEKGLVGEVRPPRENGGSVTVRLEPGAVVTGRLVDADDKPRAGIELKLSFRTKERLSSWPWKRYADEHLETDREGRFRLEALLPGYQFRLSDDKGELSLGGGLRSGQTKDLGEVRLKAED